jgi:hypothetical protein
MDTHGAVLLDRDRELLYCLEARAVCRDRELWIVTASTVRWYI